MEKTVSVFMANGMEEVECLAVVDILKRAGVSVETVSITGKQEVTSAHGIVIRADTMFEQADFSDTELFFLPGGMPGADYLATHHGLASLLRTAASQGKRMAAICAGPQVLGRLGLLQGKRATCYPGWEKTLLGAICTGEGVVTDGNITTARGLGFAIDLGLELAKLLCGEEKAIEIRRAIQHPSCISSK